MIRESLVKLSQKQTLSEKETYDCMLEILEGHATPAQVAGYLSFLSYKGETTAEVVGSVRAMREKMVRVNAEGLAAIDVCGTGGDHRGTFNISTCAALVLAGGMWWSPSTATGRRPANAAAPKCWIPWESRSTQPPPCH